MLFRSLGVFDRAASEQRFDLCWAKTPVGENFARMLTRVSGRRRRGASGTRESWRWCGLLDASDVDESIARDVMRMLRGLAHRQHGRKTNICALHNLAPLRGGLRAKTAARRFLSMGH